MSRFVLLEMVRQRGPLCEMKFDGKNMIVAIHDSSVNPLTPIYWGLTKEGICAKKEFSEKNGPYFESSLGFIAPKGREEICGLKSLLIGCESVKEVEDIVKQNLLYRCSPNIKDKFETVDHLTKEWLEEHGNGHLLNQDPFRGKNGLTIEEAKIYSNVLMMQRVQHAVVPDNEFYKVKKVA